MFELMAEFYTVLLCSSSSQCILLQEQRVALIQSRTLACLLGYRPNAYVWSNASLFASE